MSVRQQSEDLTIHLPGEVEERTLPSVGRRSADDLRPPPGATRAWLWRDARWHQCRRRCPPATTAALGDGGSDVGHSSKARPDHICAILDSPAVARGSIAVAGPNDRSGSNPPFQSEGGNVWSRRNPAVGSSDLKGRKSTHLGRSPQSWRRAASGGDGLKAFRRGFQSPSTTRKATCCPPQCVPCRNLGNAVSNQPGSQ
jgi:hypothetical protein